LTKKDDWRKFSLITDSIGFASKFNGIIGHNFKHKGNA
jgi:hypothetical protein